ncbi:MAG: hypothetical protein IPO92_21605 [Saprospiraceae bacterium]|nr:hypothetical protein [Saprospiraceae bacterium]
MKKLKPGLLLCILGSYLAIWLGYILPQSINIAIIDYSTIGIMLSIMILSCGLVFITAPELKSKVYYVVLGINILLVLLFFFIPQLLLLALISCFQGLLIGIISKSIVQRSKEILKDFSWMLLGVSLTSASILLPLPKELVVGIGYINLEMGHTYIYFIACIIILFIMFFRKTPPDLRKKENLIDYLPFKKMYYATLFFVGMLITIELVVLIWLLVLKDVSQDFKAQLTLPFICILIFALRRNVHYVLVKISNIGWIFILSLLLTISLGLFYTFTFTVFFILGYTLSITYLLSLITTLFQITLQSKQIGVILLAIAAIVFLIGLFVQNYFEFALSINIPISVLALSCKQALIKEIATVAAILVILSGIIFLKRRSI